jgi:ferritin-like metal-binding protein YciE
MAENTLVTWLKDAYAAEMAAVEELQQIHEDTEQYPELLSRIEQHIEESKRHAEDVQRCIERLDEDVSSAKNTMAELGARAKAWSANLANDDVVKFTLGMAAMEATEVASYTSLVAAAEDFDDNETADVCSRILNEEQRMYEFVIESIPAVTKKFLAQNGKA